MVRYFERKCIISIDLLFKGSWYFTIWNPALSSTTTPSTTTSTATTHTVTTRVSIFFLLFAFINVAKNKNRTCVHEKKTFVVFTCHMELKS
jgi:hypothetical protein